MPKKINKDGALAIVKKVWALDGSDEEACLAAGVSERWLDMRLADDPELKKEKKLLKNTPFLEARKTMVAKLSEDAEFALKYMKNKKNKEFSERIEEERSGDVRLTIIDASRIAEASSIDDDEL